ncbi:MAG TPA: sigma-54 factor interaction domain-containing protein, partial [Gemmatimonadaceae bacterium]|nr:sigma-54 factor interaction domain-containing protein [Gemmatimonadaceae bacterium]
MYGKPANLDEVFDGVRRALERQRLQRTTGLLGESEAIREVLVKVEQMAPVTSTVLIEGESGTGKELVARAIHRLSPRRNRPFIAVNVGALPETLLESELFGHEKGAFTGAAERRLGRFELADSGTLFLDEIGEIPSATQVKLLRVLEEREFMRVGGA